MRSCASTRRLAIARSKFSAIAITSTAYSNAICNRLITGFQLRVPMGLRQRSRDKSAGNPALMCFKTFVDLARYVEEANQYAREMTLMQSHV